VEVKKKEEKRPGEEWFYLLGGAEDALEVRSSHRKGSPKTIFRLNEQ